MLQNLCIMVAPNGARRTKVDHPELPISPLELATTAQACFDNGAQAIHLHVRDDQEQHSLSADRYAAAISKIQTVQPEIEIQITTEAAGIFTLDEQIAVVKRLKPEFVSFSWAELMRDGPQIGLEFLKFAQNENVGIQFILYSKEEIHQFANYVSKDGSCISNPPRVIVVVGRYSSDQNSKLSEFENLYDALVETGLHKSAIWMTCAFGTGEMACLRRTIELGGHVRVGFENAIVDETGQMAKDNAQRVQQVAAIAQEIGRPLANRSEARWVLGQD